MILVTGAAGFIGFHVAHRLLEQGQTVHGLDIVNAYYDPKLKEARIRILSQFPKFVLRRIDLADKEAVSQIFATDRPELVIHLAAQAGVRHSLTHPHCYVESNIVGFLNILEGCRNSGVKHLVYASSSSVYGLNTKLPLSVHNDANHPISLYGATKKANELMAHSYSHLFRLRTTGLRFFTVYGPWGRPDMAYYSFTRAILAGTPIDVFNNGSMKRDFTYIDDVVEAVVRVVISPTVHDSHWDSTDPDPATSSAPYRLYNIGNHASVDLLYFVEIIEKCLGKKAVKRFRDAQPGDVLATFADITDIARDAQFSPKTSIEDGIPRFVDWYRKYHVD